MTKKYDPIEGARNMRITLTLLAIVALLTGCNTVKGIGKDIEKGGEAIQRGASH